MLTPNHRQEILQLVQKAGAMAREFCRQPEYRKPQQKSDGSPVTPGDLAVSQFLVEELEPYGFPVVSEEGDLHIEEQGPYFLVDPIDGTKAFVKGEPDYVVLLALIVEQSPVFGVIAHPEENNLYHATQGEGACCNGKPLARKAPQKPYTAYSSGFHKHSRGQDIIQRFELGRILKRGSALKFCGLAQGVADFFPRWGPTGEWDTAAGQILLQESQCSLLDRKTGKPISYGKPKRLNRGFIACHNDLLPQVHEFIHMTNQGGSSGQ